MYDIHMHISIHIYVCIGIYIYVYIYIYSETLSRQPERRGEHPPAARRASRPRLYACKVEEFGLIQWASTIRMRFGVRSMGSCRDHEGIILLLVIVPTPYWVLMVLLSLYTHV